MNESHIKEMREILLAVQHTTSNHQKYLKKLKILFEQVQFKEFVSEFFLGLCHFFLDKSLVFQNRCVDRGIQFGVLFSTSFHTNDDDQIDPFLQEIFRRSLELTNVDRTRYRVCWFIKLILQKLGENEVSLDDNICDQIRDAMLERINDVKAVVQIQAIEVLQKLQNPHDSNDPVIKAFLVCFYNINRQVRKTVIHCIGLTVATIPLVLERCLDKDDMVRYTAYDRISKLNIKSLKIEQRQHVLLNGLKDKNKKIKILVENNITMFWLSNCNQNYFEFIHALRLDADEQDWNRTIKIVELVLTVFWSQGVLKDLIEFMALGPDKLLPFADKRWEEKVYWRCLANFLQNYEDFSNLVLPDLSVFCQYVQRVYETRPANTSTFDVLEHDQIMCELLQMMKLFDFTDEVGRKNLLQLIMNLLTEAKLNFNSVSLLINILEYLIPCPEKRCQEINNIIFDIRNPLVIKSPSTHMIRKRDVKLAELNVKLNIAIDNQEQAIFKADFVAAENLKHTIDTIKEQLKYIQHEFDNDRSTERAGRNDVLTLCKCLDIATATLQCKNLKQIPTAIKTLQDDFLQPLTMSPEPEICKRIVHIYGLIATLDKAVAIESLPLFCVRLVNYKIAPLAEVQTTILAISGITDILLLYGKDILCDDEPKKRSQKRMLFTESSVDETSTLHLPTTITLVAIIEIISTMLDDMNPQIREIACQALIKLMYNRVITSPTLLSKMILKWFNPATAKDTGLIQHLGVFFVSYVTYVPGSLEVMETAFIPTLIALVEAPRNSPLADVNIVSVIKFLIELCRPSRHKFNVGLDPYKHLTLMLCREICENPNNKRTLTFIKALVMIDAPYDDVGALNDLRRQTDLMKITIKDKSVLKYVERYRNKLDGIDCETVTNANVDLRPRSSSLDDNETFPTPEAALSETIKTGNHKSDHQLAERASTIDLAAPSTSGQQSDNSVEKLSGACSRMSVKRRKKRARLAKSKHMDESVAGPSSMSDVPINQKPGTSSKEILKTKENKRQIILVQTDSNQEQPQSKTTVIKPPVRRSDRKLKPTNPVSEEGETKSNPNKKNIKSGKHSEKESQVLLEQTESEPIPSPKIKVPIVRRISLRKRKPRKMD